MDNAVAAIPSPQWLQLYNSDVERLRRTRVAFFALCGYLLSQAFQVPFVAIGPSWATWPTISDLFAGLMVFCYVLGYRHFRPISSANRCILRYLALISASTLVAVLLTHVSALLSPMEGSARVGSFAFYQLYRLVQFTLVFRAAAGIPITGRRLRMLAFAVGSALLVAVGGLLATYFLLLNTARLVAHLPSDFNTAGPWAYLANTQMQEVGVIGYNHAYTAVQILMLGALYLAVRTTPNRVVEVVCLMAVLGSVFLTGSRAGMAATLFFATAYFVSKPGALVVASLISVFIMVGVRGIVWQSDASLGVTLDRQLAMADPFEGNALSGRQGIWRDSIAFMQENPVRWVIGAGPGAAALLDTNAHMMFLQIMLESGAVGVVIMLMIIYVALSHLHRRKSQARPVLWVTVALLISSLTQETFYPIPAFGHFLGLYLCALAVVLRADWRMPVRRYEGMTTRWRSAHARNRRVAVLQLGTDAG